MNQLKIAIVFLLIIIVILLLKDCGGKPSTATPLVNTDSLRATIKEEMEDKAILQKLAVQSDSVSVVYRDRWHKAKEVKGPCDSILPVIIQAGDSMAAKDSTALASYRKLSTKNDSIITHLFSLVKADSINYSALQDTVRVRDGKIKKLKRKVFWANFRTVLVGAGWVAREVYYK